METARLSALLPASARARCSSRPAARGRCSVCPVRAERRAVCGSQLPPAADAARAPQLRALQLAGTLCGVLGALAQAHPALAQAAAAALPDVVVPDENLLSDFNVSFLGLKVDHRVIVEWVVLGQTVGFVGSLVAGLSARSRKEEVEALNSRLVAVNKQLREKARATQAGLYGPAVCAAEPVPGASGSEQPAQSAEATEVISTLRAGKSLLKMRDGPGAKAHFERALALTRTSAASLETPWKAQRKALRGLGAASQLMGDNDAALGYMKEVLALSEASGDNTGVADAMGVIADIFTDKGDLDNAGRWYDKYINAMQG